MISYWWQTSRRHNIIHTNSIHFHLIWMNHWLWLRFLQNLWWKHKTRKSIKLIIFSFKIWKLLIFVCAKISLESPMNQMQVCVFKSCAKSSIFIPSLYRQNDWTNNGICVIISINYVSTELFQRLSKGLGQTFEQDATQNRTSTLCVVLIAFYFFPVEFDLSINAWFVNINGVRSQL